MCTRVGCATPQAVVASESSYLMRHRHEWSEKFCMSMQWDTYPLEPYFVRYCQYPGCDAQTVESGDAPF